MIDLKTLRENLKKSDKLRPALLGVFAFLAGIVNGFLGTGGGIVLMFALSLLVSENELARRDKFATLIAVILPISLISAVFYGKTIDFSAATPYIIPGILGGITGALILDRINPKILKKLFAVMVIWAGINFIK